MAVPRTAVECAAAPPPVLGQAAPSPTNHLRLLLPACPVPVPVGPSVFTQGMVQETQGLARVPRLPIPGLDIRENHLAWPHPGSDILGLGSPQALGAHYSGR